MMGGSGGRATNGDTTHARRAEDDGLVRGAELRELGVAGREAGQVEVHKPRVRGAERRRAEPPRLHAAGRRVLDHDVGARDVRERARAPGARLEV